jgi:phospholipase C
MGSGYSRSFGVRVPAIVVSPWVARQSVSKISLDHTSIIKTILLRFCRQPDGTIPDMGARVTAANHLGSLLTEITPRPPRRTSNYQATINRIAAWHGEVFKKRFQDFGVRQTPQELTEFQRGLLAAAVAMSKKRASKEVRRR